ncbi:MAG: type II secretion system inner membrane protein GspF [Steroidobacteraceae bacterium]
MGAFQYTAVDTSGLERQGVEEGDSAKQIRQILRERGLLPISVEEVHRREARSDAARSFSRTRTKRLNARELALTTRQLSTLVRSGLPLDESLLAVSEQTEHPHIRSIMMGVRAKVLEGHPLAEGLADFPSSFPEIYRATVAAGEQSGHLDTVLERLSDYTESREQLRSRTINALLYPAMLFVVCSGIVMLMLTFVVPKIVKQFDNAKTSLPLMTRMLIGFSDFMRAWGLWLLIFAVVAGVLFVRSLRNPDNRRRFHAFLLRVPLLGRVVRGTNTTRFARTFATLTSSAVPVLDAMRISGEVVSNLPMRDAVQSAAIKVREGSPIGRSLGATRQFPPMMIHLISSGESSGELETMLDRAATNQEREMDAVLGAFVGLLGPLMIVIMAGIVLFIVLAMLLPIFQLNELVGS